MLSFPGFPALVGEAGNAALIEIDHVADTVDGADHLGCAHIGQRLGEKLAASFGAALARDFPVPVDGPEIFGENLAQQTIELHFIVASFSHGIDNLLRIDPKVHAEKTIEAAAEVFLV